MDAGWRRWLRGVDLLWNLALMAFVLGGVAFVPFHGDESTLIMMSRDYYYQFIAGDWQQVFYHDPPLNATEQHLRLLNGTLSKYLIGLAWHVAGLQVSDLNDQWDWGADWDWNVASGRMPSVALLAAARWSAALPGALSVAAMFVLGWRWGRRRVAYPASFLLATHGVILIHVRRAYMEAALQLGSLLVILAAIWWVERLARRGEGMRRWLLPALALGTASGLALASKHSGAVPVVAAGLGVLIVAARLPGGAHRQALGGLAIGAALAVAVFLALNPAWWGDPIGRASQVLRLRADLVADQVAIFPEVAYADLPARIGGLIAQVTTADPAYYEVKSWAEPLGEAIAGYEASPWAGIRYGQGTAGEAAGVILLALALVGAVRLGWEWQAWVAAPVVGMWTLLTVLFTLAAVPLAWQRYVLPLLPVIVLLAAGGLAWLPSLLARVREQQQPERGPDAPPHG
ncbi:MAG: phospholipid carrier-dependent glycosyltransferase [Anaerolineae bacterium]|nr:phospholipid carrier-dependent glycosyltransferase [Anaerolineae bacterium]